MVMKKNVDTKNRLEIKFKMQKRETNKWNKSMEPYEELEKISNDVREYAINKEVRSC